MGWARLDDGFHDHPKVDELSLSAIGLWTVCLTWAHRHRRTAKHPGVIPTARVRKVAGRQATSLAAELTAAGLWEVDTDGYAIHDFDDYGPKQRDSTEASAAGRRGAEARWAKNGKAMANSHDAATEPDGSQVANDMATDASRASAPASPSRPVPEEQQLAPATPARKRPRPPDPLWDAVVAACGIDTNEITASARSGVNQALKQLRDIDADARQVEARAAVFRQRYPTVTLTPSALAKHWPQLTTTQAAGGDIPWFQRRQ